MENLANIGDRFTIGNTTYEITDRTPVDPELKATIRVMKETGKDLYYYSAKRVGKRGLSKRGSLYLRFTKTGNFISYM